MGRSGTDHAESMCANFQISLAVSPLLLRSRELGRAFQQLTDHANPLSKSFEDTCWRFEGFFRPLVDMVESGVHTDWWPLAEGRAARCLLLAPFANWLPTPTMSGNEGIPEKTTPCPSSTLACLAVPVGNNGGTVNVLLWWPHSVRAGRNKRYGTHYPRCRRCEPNWPVQ